MTSVLYNPMIVWVANSKYEGVRPCGAVLRALVVVGTVRPMRDLFILAIHLLVTAAKLLLSLIHI